MPLSYMRLSLLVLYPYTSMHSYITALRQYMYVCIVIFKATKFYVSQWLVRAIQEVNS